jgi:hypothetical protein
VNKVKEKQNDKPEAEKSEEHPHRSSRPRSFNTSYKDPSSEEDDMDVWKPPTHDLGLTCVSTDPRRTGQLVGGENLILTKEEIRKLLEIQSKLEDQQVWMTTTQAGFPTIPVEDEIHTTQDLQLGRPTVRHLHPEI